MTTSARRSRGSARPSASLWPARPPARRVPVHGNGGAVALQTSRVGQSPSWDDDAELRPLRPGEPISGGISVRVDDVDAHYERALAFGAQVLKPPTPTPSGSASTQPLISRGIAGDSRSRLLTSTRPTGERRCQPRRRRHRSARVRRRTRRHRPFSMRQVARPEALSTTPSRWSIGNRRCRRRRTRRVVTRPWPWLGTLSV
jgi:hypothetical protein